MRGLMIGFCASVVLGVLMVSDAQAQQRRGIDFRQEPACQTLQTTAMGGPAPKDPNLVVMRYLGASNHEIAFRDQVILFNAYYEHFPPARQVGFTRAEVSKANLILVGHAHGDHFADVPFVAQKTGATVIGAPITTDLARKSGIADKQVVTVTGKGGEVQRFKGFTVEPLLGTHKTNSPEYGRSTGAAFRGIMDAMGLARTPADQERARGQIGSNDPKITTEGTLGYLITTDNGFRIMLRDASGEPTDVEKATMQRLGRTDVAVVAYTTYVPQPQVPLTLALVQLYRPTIYMPTHHDDTGGGRLETPVEPMFTAIRDTMPETRSISPLYRTPVCFDTQTRDVFVGR